MIKTVSIPCEDGIEIKGRWFLAKRPPLATVIVAPGAAAEARFYHAFCEFLAESGFDALSFDFRSIGESTLNRKKRRDSGFTSWIELDFPAVITHARMLAGEKPLIVVGHSAGGWMAGVQPATNKVDAIIGVAALSGHWRFMARPQRYAHWLAWHLLVPTACRVFGVWPGLIGFRKNLSPRFGIEFSRWARRRDFVFSEPNLAANALRFRGQMHLFQISDDPWGTAAAVSAFSERFPNASALNIESVIADNSIPEPIGHFGMFRKVHTTTLWPRIESAIRTASLPSIEHPNESRQRLSRIA